MSDHILNQGGSELVSVAGHNSTIHQVEAPDRVSGEIQRSDEQTSDNVSQFQEPQSDTGSLFNFGVAQDKKTFRERVQQRKEKNLNNIRIAKFRKAIQRKDTVGGQVQLLSQEKIKLLPAHLENDPYEALLYLYFTIRYYDEQMFKVILSRASNLLGIQSDIQALVRDARSYQRLTVDDSYDRLKFNQACFETALDKDYIDVAHHFIEHGYVQITWEMVRKMLSNKQEYLVKQCIKFQCKFDSTSANLKKINFAGRTTTVEERKIRLVDFIQIMLELKWKSAQITWVLQNYNKRGGIDNIEDLRELFLLFAMKRKLKLMSLLINSDDFLFEFTENNFTDVIENDVYDIGVLLYREYFLKIVKQKDYITQLLVSSFQKANGQLESKCYLLRRFIGTMRYDQANLFVEAVEERVKDSSRGNILVNTLNVVKSGCLLIELLNKVKSNFSFMLRQIDEIIDRITTICVEFMNKVQSEDEMRFLLLEKDLDNRDALNMIYDNNLAKLLEHPFAQNIVYQIWTSPYNNSQSFFCASSNHQLLWDYNHCRYDLEARLRFYRRRSLKNMGCHGFQFQVWRYAAQSRYLVQAVCVLGFAIIVQIHMTQHMSMALWLKENQSQLFYSLQVEREPTKFTQSLTQSQLTLQLAQAKQAGEYIMQFYRSANLFIIIMYFQWMFVFQQFYQAMYAGRNKRVMKYFQFENVLDTVMLFVGMAYLSILLRDYRDDTFIKDRSYRDEAITFFQQYCGSPVNENVILFIWGTLLWIKTFHQLSYLEITGSLYQILIKLMRQLIIFCMYYFSVLFLYSIVGVVLFNDIPEFADLAAAMFTLFRSTIKDYNIYVMQGAAVGDIIGYVYFNTYLILNVTLLVNLIVGQLAYAYKKYQKKGGVLMLLYTLSVRDVSEADEKYSSVVSVPFPLTLCNLVFGSIVLGAKSPFLNLCLLHFYFLPVMLVCLALFMVYQVVILPFVYLKMLGHKWALIVKAPVGKGSSSSLDRAGQFFIFLIFGPLLLILNVVVDTVWYLIHIYRPQLDRSNSSKAFIGEDNIDSVEIQRRTYKKMLDYFEIRNDQLVLQKQVAQDLRDYLDVEEGLRCMIWGKPEQISLQKLELYRSYAQPGEQSVDRYFGVEKLVSEYATLKQVLINNAIPVDLAEIESGGQEHGAQMNTKGWGSRVLFDKKVFLQLLRELENMRKVLQVKKMYYIFNLPYEGKPASLNKWHRKVQHRTNQTLKFMSSARLLRIINYDPTQYINISKINQLRKQAEHPVTKRSPIVQMQSKQVDQSTYEMKQVLQQISGANQFLDEITAIIREVNGNEAKNKIGSKIGSPPRFDKQARMNALKPTASGVISSPDPKQQSSIQQISVPVPRRSSVRNMLNINGSFIAEGDDDGENMTDEANLTLSSANFESPEQHQPQKPLQEGLSESKAYKTAPVPGRK